MEYKKIMAIFGALIIVVVGFMLISNVSAWNTNVFNNSLSTENITYTNNQSFTRYLSIPNSTTRITHGYLNIEGLNKIVSPVVYFINSSKDWDRATGWTGLNESYYSNLIYANASAVGPPYGYNITFTLNKVNQTISGVNLYHHGISFYQYGLDLHFYYNDSTNATHRLSPFSFLTDYTLAEFQNPNPTKPVTRMVLNVMGSNPDVAYISNISFNITNYSSVNYYTSKVNLTIGKNQTFYHLGNFTTNNRTSNLNNFIKPYMNSTYLVGSDYLIPFIFYSNTSGILRYSNLLFDDAGFVENGQNYSNSSYETQSKTFTINITYDSGDTSTSGSLYYNGTKYLGSASTTSGNTIYSATIDIPIFNKVTNVSFYWSFNMSVGGFEGSYDSTISNHTVYPIYLSLCNSTINNSVLNFTTIDENLLNELNASIDVDFSAWLGSGTIKKNYSYNDSTQTASRFNFCFYPNIFSSNYTLRTDMDMYYTKTGYSDRTYYLRSAILTNISNLINLPLLNSTLAQKFFFTVNKGSAALTDSLVTISKCYPSEDSCSAIGIRKTDAASGEFIEYLEIDKIYKYYFVKDGVSYGPITKTAICSSSPCIVILSLDSAVSDIYSGYYDNFAQNIAYNLSYNPFSKIVTVTYTDLTGLAQYVRLNVVRLSANQSGSTICDDYLYAVAGTINCNMSSYEGDFRANMFISRSPERIVHYISFLASNVSQTLGTTGMLVSLFIFMIIVMAFWADASLGLIVTPISLIILRIMEFLPLSWGLIGGITLLCFYLASKTK